VHSQTKDAQHGERGYILTGQERYLDPYHSAQEVIDNDMVHLRKLIADNPAQLSRLSHLEAMIEKDLTQLDEADRSAAGDRIRGRDAGCAIRRGQSGYG
jgi:CHASE3 domain sensor protein